MGVIALQENLDAEQAGEIRALELVAVQYTGSHSSIAPRGALNTQGKWPGTALLNQGTWYFALVPDEGLAYLENRDDLDVVYADDTEAFAAALLDANRLPENVFGRGADLDLQERVENALGLEDPMQAGPIEEQLYELAGVDANETEDEPDDTDRVSALVDEYSRSGLKEAVKEVREGTDEFSLQGAGVTEMAEYLAGQDDAEVNAALEVTADDGGDA